MADIVLLAEYTTNEGPYGDDYFLVFVTIEDGQVLFAAASFYSDGRDEVIKQLAGQWHVNIDLGLANSTEWKSRIMGPPELAGREYFEFREVAPKGFRERLSKRVFGPTYRYFLSKAARDFIGRKRSRT